MELSFITKTSLALKITFYHLMFICYVRFASFKRLYKYLIKTKSSNGSKNKIDSNKIFIYENKISKFFKIKKCLISACCLYKILKEIGYEPVLCIGINKKNDDFFSHAWIELNNEKVLYDPTYKKILSIS